jgi:hypothetical protein
MAARIQKLAAHLTTNYGGDVTRMWSDESSADEVVRRFAQLPGFGRPKARILLALLGKQLGVTPLGWREAAGSYGQDGDVRSIADVVDQASFDALQVTLRQRKQAKNQQARNKQAKKKAAAGSVGGTAGRPRSSGGRGNGARVGNASASADRSGDPATTGPDRWSRILEVPHAARSG